jgi:hypothetical protein
MEKVKAQRGREQKEKKTDIKPPMVRFVFSTARHGQDNPC